MTTLGVDAAVQSGIARHDRYFLGAALAIIVMMLGIAFVLLRFQHTVEERTYETAGDLAALISSNLENDFQRIDDTLASLAHDFSREQRAPNAAERERLLLRAVEMCPIINVVRIADAAGNVIHGPGQSGPTTNLSDRSYFQRLRDDPSAGPQVAGPLLGRTTGETVMVFARRISRPGGAFDGVVFISYPLSLINKGFSELSIRESDTLEVRSNDLQLIALHPPRPDPSQKNPPLAAEFRQALERDPAGGRYLTRNGAGQASVRQVAFHRNPRYGFYVNVGVESDTAWLPWATVPAAIFIAVFVLGGFALLLAWRLRQSLMAAASTNAKLLVSQQQLAESAYLINVAGEISQIGGWVLELPSRKLTWADETCRIHDVPAGTPITLEAAIDFYTPTSRPLIQAALQAAIDHATPWDLELQIITARGRELWIRSIGRIGKRDGQRFQVLGTSQNIDERKRLQDKLINSRAQLRQFLDHLPAAAFLTDADSRVLVASLGFKTFFGLDPLQMIGRCSNDLFPGSFGEKIVADNRRIIDAGATERLIEHFGGKSYETTKFVVSSGSERLLGGITMDVTQRIRNQARTDALLKLSESSRDLDEAALLNLGLELAEATTASHIGFLHFVNDDQESIELVTWTKGALQGCTAAFDNHYPISKAGIWADCFRERRAVTFNDYAAYAEKRGLPSGHAPLLRLISVPVIESGKVRVMVGVGNKATPYDEFDVETVQLIGNDLWRMTRRSRAEAALRVQVSALEELNKTLTQTQSQLLQSEKMASIGQLAAGVAHELNNPIGFVQSNLGTLKTYVNDLLDIIEHCQRCNEGCQVHGKFDAFQKICEEKDLAFIKEDVRQLLAESTDGTERVRRIVQNLKDFSHVSEDEWQWADLHKGIESTLNLVWNELKYKAEVCKAYGELPEVFCLASQINQVIMNLLVNAAHAIDKRGTITIASGVLEANEAQSERVWIEVRDTGCGIPEENLKRIFDPFFTTKPVGKGTGLGLSLAWSIVRKHHGSLEVHSEVGTGTTFRMILPVNGNAS